MVRDTASSRRQEISRAASASAAERREDEAQPGLADMVPRLDRISRPSLAVLPFRFVGSDERYAALASALPDELITDLARLHWLFVTARGSSFRLRAPDTDFGDVGRLLRRPLLPVGHDRSSRTASSSSSSSSWTRRTAASSGPIASRDASRTCMRCASRSARRFSRRSRSGFRSTKPRAHVSPPSRISMPGPHTISACNTCIASIAPTTAPPPSCSNARLRWIQRLLARTPDCRSSTSRLRSCITRTTSPGQSVSARRCAARGLELDPLDPFVNFTMGRTYWLDGDLDTSLELAGARDRCQSALRSRHLRPGVDGSARRAAAEGRQHVDLAMRLSPLDPLHYAMLATRAFTHMVLGEDAEAAQWAERGARSPGAHVLIAMIAAAAHELAGDKNRAAFWAANVRERNSSLTRASFFRAFPMKVDAMRTRVDRALAGMGF